MSVFEVFFYPLSAMSKLFEIQRPVIKLTTFPSLGKLQMKIEIKLIKISYFLQK